MMTNKIYKLKNQIKHYEWGSVALMPDFLGVKNPENLPFAEMWMGTHTGAPSFAGDIPLKNIAGDLPFLFKLLAVEKPLSIQAHPNKEKALLGFALEEEAKVDMKSPMRNYKDPNDKPELLCAITQFSFMAGFRSKENIKELLEEFLSELPQLKEIISPLQKSLNTNSLAVFFRILFDFSKLEREYIGEIIRNKETTSRPQLITQELWALMKSIAHQYPQDPAIISPLYLNYITLQPGQAVYLPPGILHSYISGFGVELMTSSDNVLRGGLTPKYIDIPELMSILDFKPHDPNIFSPDLSSQFSYENENFSLSIMKGEGKELAYTGKKPAICLVTEGELFAEEETFKKGESFFIIKDTEELIFNGKFSAFIASS